MVIACRLKLIVKNRKRENVVIPIDSNGTDYIDPRYRSEGTVTVLTDDRCRSEGEGTADCVFHPDSSCRITDFDLSDEEIAERNRYIRACRLRLFSDLGAFVLNGQLVYWRDRDRRIPRQQVRDRRPMVIRAGYMSESRGRHWDRKRNWELISDK